MSGEIGTPRAVPSMLADMVCAFALPANTVVARPSTASDLRMKVPDGEDDRWDEDGGGVAHDRSSLIIHTPRSGESTRTNIGACRAVRSRMVRALDSGLLTGAGSGAPFDGPSRFARAP